MNRLEGGAPATPHTWQGRMNSNAHPFSRLAVVFGLGFFALASQSLLFREFFSVFEGNELGVGVFFSSWLLWSGVGALAARPARRLASSFEWLPLLYLPAFLLQHHLVHHARALAGVEPYELFPLAKMLPMAVLANAPVSFITGLLFPLACAWITAARGLPPARVYFFEALGGAAGGVAVTAALAAGWPGETVFLAGALLPAAAPFLARRRISALVPMLLVLAALGFRLDRAWRDRNDRAAWSRMLPAESLRGRFLTPQATYLYGDYAGQFVVRAWESVVESIPDDEHAGEVAALALAQSPAAKSILILGGGYSLCERFLKLPQVQSVTWLHPDPAYPCRLRAALPELLHADEGRLRAPGLDPRRFLRKTDARFDLALVALPDTTTLSLNRYGTVEFYKLLRERLDPAAGAVAVRFSGGENYLGGELVNLGASLVNTVGAVFPKQALQPGGESWLFASIEADLADSPEEARARFAGIPGAEVVSLPDRLLSAFPADRVEFQRLAYREAMAGAPAEWWLNTDSHPRALLHALLLVGLQGGAGRGVSAAARALSLMGPFVLLLPWLLYGLLRFVYRRRGGSPGTARHPPVSEEGRARTPAGPMRGVPPVFDAGFLVFSAGLAGMAFSMVLMFLYQSAFGSLYLQIGLLSALFMLGLFAGGWIVERALVRLGREPAGLLPLAVALHAALILFAWVVTARLGPFGFAALFAAAGFFSGLYVPVAVFRLRQAGRDDASAGAVVEWLDTLGGAAGGLLVGLILLPLYGLAAGLAVPALALAANLPAHFRKARSTTGVAADRWAHRLGYLLAGVTAWALFASWSAERSRRPEPGALLREAAEHLVPGQPYRVEQKEACTYLALAEGGYLFTTDQTAPDVSGYGGPVTLGVRTDAGGVLLEARILRASETPGYQRLVEQWLPTLAGRNLFDVSSLAGVDGASGATLTSRAVLETLRASGCFFSQKVLGRAPAGQEPPARAFPVEPEAVALLVLAAAALVLRRRPAPWLRRAFLLAVVLFFGWRWNLQYSAAHVLGLIAGAWPAPGLTVPFVLLAGVPILAALFGNIYCGWLCPFGALQELAGEPWPRAWRFDPDKPAWRFARWLKYALLFALLLAFARTREMEGADMDPLNTVFSALRTPAVLALGATLLALSVIYRRFWCRNLCPAGAFLSLLNGLKLTLRWWPPIRPGCCDYGVRHVRELDCILCDRCRTCTPSRTYLSPVLRAVVFYAALAGTVLCFAPRLRTAGASPAPTAVSTESAIPRVHRARDVDMSRLRDLIDRGRLSTNEALYYRPMDDGAPE